MRKKLALERPDTTGPDYNRKEDPGKGKSGGDPHGRTTKEKIKDFVKGKGLSNTQEKARKFLKAGLLGLTGTQVIKAANAAKIVKQKTGKAVKQAIGPEGPAAALTTLSSAFKTNKDAMIRIGAGALAAKLVVSSLGGSKILGAVGPLKLRA